MLQDAAIMTQNIINSHFSIPVKKNSQENATLTLSLNCSFLSALSAALTVSLSAAQYTRTNKFSHQKVIETIQKYSKAA